MEQDIDKAIKIHDQVFGYHETYSKDEIWQSKNLFKIYFVDQDSFLAIEKREHSFHIWLMGSIKKQAGHGTKLFKELAQDAYMNDKKIITVATVPTKFPHMYAWLQKIGFKDVSTEWSNGIEKIHMKIETDVFCEYFT